MADMHMRFKDGLRRALTLSYDDGVEQDIKLIEIAKKYGLKGTFNLNSGCYPPEDVKYEPGRIHRRMPKSVVSKVYKDCGWEIAAHGYEHPFLDRLPANAAMMDIIKDRNELEKQFGTIVRGFAYPYGTYNDTVVSLLKSAGLVYARTVNASHNFFVPETEDEWLRLSATCHHNDPELPKLIERFENEPYDHPMMFYVWGHSYEFEERDNWELIEDFGKKLGNRDDIWYATNIEIYDYVRAYKQLLFDVDMTRVYNPTVIKLWFVYKGKTFSVAPGETVDLTF